jgi:hypothetical protein
MPLQFAAGGRRYRRPPEKRCGLRDTGMGTMKLVQPASQSDR